MRFSTSVFPAAGRVSVPLWLLSSCLTLFFLAPAHSKPPRTKEGDILRIFDSQRVYIITNDDSALADALLEGCPLRQKRILSLEEWKEMPDGIRALVSRVFLINREKLPQGVNAPEKCGAENDELFTQVTRTDSTYTTTYETILSAPDSAHLQQAIVEFRRFAEMPRNPIRRNVQSLAIVPLGPETERLARKMMSGNDASAFRLAHILRPGEYAQAQNRLSCADELLLIDRSAINGNAPTALASAAIEQPVSAADTVAWRTRKSDGRWRVVVTAPNADQLAGVLKTFSSLKDIPEDPTVLAKARDLRGVRRIAVAGIKQGKATELARQLASQAAMDVRALDAFEVVERDGLSQILGEIALGQAGITRAGDRVRVQRLAAADALLLVEITGIEGRTDYTATHRRLSAFMSAAPPKPMEPSRLKNTLGISDPTMVKIVESLFSKNIGTKSDDDYKEERDRYQYEILPRWQKQMEFYQQERRNRPVTWEQKTIAHSAVRVRGSLRLVDLSDGLVLWEAPFTAADASDSPFRTAGITITGEDNRPGPEEMPQATAQVPDELLERAALTGMREGVVTLKNTALLPTSSALAVVPVPAPASTTPAATVAPAVLTGKILDVDADTLLIGLGAGDGLKVGDSLVVTVDGGQRVPVLITKIRPRTCDAVFDKSATPAQRTGVTVGQMVTRK